MRKQTCTNIRKTFEVSAKSLKKGDLIWLGKRSYTVKSNTKNDYGKRVIELKWGSKKEKDSAILIVPRDVTFAVNQHEHIRHQ